MSLCVHKADLTKHSKQERERKESTNVDLKKKKLLNKCKATPYYYHIILVNTVLTAADLVKQVTPL